MKRNVKEIIQLDKFCKANISSTKEAQNFGSNSIYPLNEPMQVDKSSLNSKSTIQIKKNKNSQIYCLDKKEDDKFDIGYGMLFI